jgi:ArsR family transcriptional regulator, arsenate/arsenite/antimonite-responsive transcriptional repressor
MVPMPRSPKSTPSPDQTAAVDVLRFLSDGNRLRVLRLLAQRESCVGDVIAALDLPQPLVSYHLRRLREVGLVRARRRAQWVFYSLDPEGWARFTQPVREVFSLGPFPPEAATGASETCGPRAGPAAP